MHTRYLAGAILIAAAIGCGSSSGGPASAPASSPGAGGGSSAGGTSASAGQTGAGGAGDATAAAGTSAAGSTGLGGASATAGAAGAGGDAPSFIAFASSFQGFQNWTSFPLGNVAPTTNEMDGPRTIYINQLPPSGSMAFPLGTIIVKAIQNDPPSNWQVFAMVKRGGGFNALGAEGWEWFELTLTDDYTVDVQWRGVAPPNSGGYGGGIKGGICNGCHYPDALNNDFVEDSHLQLANL